MRPFTSDQGREYRYDPSDRLGQGSALTQVFRGEDDEGNAVAVKQVFIRLDTSGRRRADSKMADREVEIARQLRDAQGAYLVPVLKRADTGLLWFDLTWTPGEPPNRSNQ
jgi:hypothetical protein